MLPFLFLILALGCLSWATLLLVRRWTDLRLLDPMTIKEERHRQKREEMIRKRFDRMRNEKSHPWKRLGRSIGRAFDTLYESLSARLLSGSEEMNGAGVFASLAPTTQERVKGLVTEARAFYRDQKWSEAEKRYLEVLTLDPHHVEAYKGLGAIYVKQKLYPQAQETFQFILKMKKADDMTYAALADIEEAQGRSHEAEIYRLQAVEASPKQAARHAELAQFYLGQDEPLKAWPSAHRAVELEQNSAKFAELALEIAIKLGEREEARARYQRFRLLSEDRQKYQYWREKVEALEREHQASEVGVSAKPSVEAPKKRRVGVKKTVEKNTP